MMLLRGSRHSRLVITSSEAVGGHTLVHRLVQRQFSSAPIRRGNAPHHNHKMDEIIKGKIKFINSHPDLTAEKKYRNSKRLFAMLDSITSQEETFALLIKRKPILRAIEQPEVIQRRRKGLPDPHLTRVANYFRELRILYEKESAANWHAFRLIMVAHRDDLLIWPRLVHIPRYIYQELGRRRIILVLRLAGFRFARWLT